MTQARIALGKSGEDLACTELERRGYVVLARRYRRRGGELDIVARDGETIVFVEVKTREDRAFGDGSEAVTPWKQRRMTHLANDFLARHRLVERPCRFDVIAIHFANGAPVIDWFENAFDASF